MAHSYWEPSPETTPIDAGATLNRWKDYCQYPVITQKPDGSWNGYAYWGEPLEAAWCINILNATATVTPPPPGVPEPATPSPRA
ncbi:MAG: hypothetical protein ACLP9S_01815 [Syntrophales bacterium]